MYMYMLTAVVLSEREEHPALRRNVIVCVVKHGRSANSQVLPARQVVLGLVIAHANFVPSLVEVAVWLVDKDVELLQLRV